MYPCVHRNCESGLAIIYKHTAHGHTLLVISLVPRRFFASYLEEIFGKLKSLACETSWSWMAWTDDSTLAISIALL